MNDYKREAVRQFFKYFMFWFIAVVLVIVVTIVAGIAHSKKEAPARGNLSAPEERVYDGADILTDEEEELLRQYIAEKEAFYQADFVIVTFSMPVEGEEALQLGFDTGDWETNMMNLADDFWDECGYGYNVSFEGDGAILIDNRYPGQRGEWLSTSGEVEHRLDSYDVGYVLDAVDEYYDSNPYKAYMGFIDQTCSNLSGGEIRLGMGYYLIAIIGSVITAVCYANYHLKKNDARDTVSINAYISGGTPISTNSIDNFIRKNVVSRRIETSSSSGGGGGGGHHRSRSGASHGGGGRRH